MDQLTLTDRFVLFVVRRSESAVSVRALTRLTGLTSGEVDEAFQRLALQGSIEFVEPQGETCYRPIELSDVPLVIDFEEWLDVYCSRPPEVEEGDGDDLWVVRHCDPSRCFDGQPGRTVPDTTDQLPRSLCTAGTSDDGSAGALAVRLCFRS